MDCFLQVINSLISFLLPMLSVVEMLLLFVQLLNFDGFVLSNRANYGKQPEAPPDRLNEVTKLYAQACKEVAKEAGVPVIDVWSVFQQTQNWRQAYLRSVQNDPKE
jgi:hypothetical protein